MEYSLAELKIEVTHRCTLDCIHCSSESTPSVTREMSSDECFRLIREAGRMGVRKLAFSGGEPLLYPDLIGSIEEARKLGIEIDIYTSGNSPNAVELFESFFRLGISKVVFSIFGSSATSHERVTRTGGSFQLTNSMATVASKLGLRTEYHFVPFSTNVAELEEIAKLTRGIGASALSVLRFVPQGRGASLPSNVLNRLQNAQLARAIRKLREDGYVIRTGSPYNFLFVNEPAECNSGKNRLVIGPTLEAYPCDAFKQISSEDITGTNAYASLKGIALSDYWVHSPYLQAVRAYLSTPFNEPCQHCKQLDSCHSGCLAQKIISNGSLKKSPDPDCILLETKK